MRSLRTVILTLLTAFVPVVSYSQVAGGTLAEQQDYTFAVGLYRDGQYALALQQFKNFLKNYPNASRSDEITFLCGECLIQQKLYDSALIYYQKVLAAYPSSSYFERCHLRLGEIYLQTDNFTRSEAELKSVLSGSRDVDLQGEASYRLGQLFADKDDYSNAIKYFELSYEGYPKSAFVDYAMYGEGWCYGKTGKFDEGKRKFGELLARFPDTKLRPDVIEKMGECDFFVGNYATAIAEFDSSAAISMNEESAEPAVYYEGRAYEGLSQPDSAKSTFSRYLLNFPNGQHTDEVKLLYARLLDVSIAGASESIRLLSGIPTKSPFYLDSRIEVSNAYQVSGSPDSARATLEQLLKSTTDHEAIARTDFALGKLLFEQKSYQESEKAFVSASNDAGLYPESMKNAALSASAHGDYKSAKAYFLDAISRLKGDDLAKAHFDYAASLYAGSDYAGAGQIYLTAANIATNEKEKEEAIYMAAESYYRAGQYGTSLTNYRNYLKEFQNGQHESGAVLGIAYSSFYLNDFTTASEYFRKFIDAGGNSPLIPVSYLRLGDCYYYGKDYKKAIDVYESAAKKFANDTTSAYDWYQDGQANYRLGQYGPAITAFEFVVSTYSGTAVAPEAHYAMGWVYFTMTKYPQAIAEFDEVIAQYPESPVAARSLSTKGDAFYNQGKYQDALSSYQALLEKYPSSDYVDNAIMGMQYCLTVLGRSSEAESVIDNFVREHPSLATIDRIYYKKVDYDLNQKRYADAERDLKEFIVKFPRSPLVGKVLYNLANVELTLGKEKSAMGILSDLIDRKPADEYSTAGKIKLAEIYQGRKNFAEAGRMLASAVEAGDSYMPAALVDLGKLDLAEGDTAKAESSLLQASQSGVDSLSGSQAGEAKILLSGIYFERGQTKDAVDLANSVAKSREDAIGAEAQLRVAEYYCRSGDSTDAVLAFLRVKYVFSSFSDIVAQSQLEMADCVADFGNIREARSVLQDLIQSRSEDSYTRSAREKLRSLRTR